MLSGYGETTVSLDDTGKAEHIRLSLDLVSTDERSQNRSRAGEQLHNARSLVKRFK